MKIIYVNCGKEVIFHKNEGECFIRVSKHEKTDESTGHLLINICSSTVFFWKLIFKHTCLDILTRVFGYLITRVWICSLPDIKKYPCDSNEDLCIINEFEKKCLHTRAMFLKTGRKLSYLRAAM